jgi:hypothetical protein
MPKADSPQDQPRDPFQYTPPPPIPPPIPWPDNGERLPELNEAADQIQGAKIKQQTAKQQTKQALKKVRKAEKQAKSAEKQLRKEIETAKQQVQKAERQTKTAKKRHREGKQRVEELDGGEQGTFNIAGYTPGDLATALVEPPEPKMPKDDLMDADKQAVEQIHDEAKAVAKAINRTEEQVKTADKQIAKAEKTAQNTIGRQANIIHKLSGLILALSQQNADVPIQKPYMAFLILGTSLLVLGLITLPLANVLVGIILLLAAIIQIAMGTWLKKISG